MQEEDGGMKKDTRPYWKVAASLFFSLLGTILFIVIGIQAIGFFMPFVIGWFIAYLAYPLVGWLESPGKDQEKVWLGTDYYSGNCHCGRAWIPWNCQIDPGNSDGSEQRAVSLQ